MADLDDFFAKKDKKKKGKGKKYTSKTPQNLTEPTVQAPVEDDSSKDIKIDLPNTQSKDEEWIEEAEVVEDLEGLKVAPLKQEESEEGSKLAPPTDGTEDREGDRGDPVDKNLAKQGASPWQRTLAEEEEESSEEEEKEPTKPAHPADGLVSEGKYVPPSLRNQATPTHPTDSPGAGGKYVPPSLRNQGSSTGGAGGRSWHKKSAPPDIQNTQAFPTLQASLSATPTQTDKDFTEVKGSKKGSRSVDTSFSVELTNKFSTLS